LGASLINPELDRFYESLRAPVYFMDLKNCGRGSMDRQGTSDYEGAPPPKSSLGSWLLKQARDLRAAIESLAGDVAADHDEVDKLRGLVDQLLAEAERSAKVQAVQAVELEQVKQLAKQTRQQLNGVKISRGIHKARAQKLVRDMEHRLN
jgi:hypothetical protein